MRDSQSLMQVIIFLDKNQVGETLAKVHQLDLHQIKGHSRLESLYIRDRSRII
jgi:hypothetical protein